MPTRSNNSWLAAIPIFLALGAAVHAQPRPVFPPNGPAPVGPYTPGVVAGGYLYVSGQGARTPQGVMPDTFEEQARQTLENVKTIVEAAGLTMGHVVYTQVYLEDITKADELDRAFVSYFPQDPPAGALLGVARLPGTPVEINAVAVLNLAGRRAVSVRGIRTTTFSAGVLTHDRLFISSLPGQTADGVPPSGPAEEVISALDRFKAVVDAAGLTLAHTVFVNPYLTPAISPATMNKIYAARFEFGNAPARATILVNALPGGNIVFTGVAVRDLSKRSAVRPKNMPPSPTASPCVFAGDTLYCSAKTGFIPGPNSGIYASTVEHQVRQTMRNLLDNLEEAGLTFSDTVASNVYLDSVDDFTKMNGVYAQYFREGVKPSRTTIQQAPPGPRDPDTEGRHPALEQISILAVRQVAP